MSEDHTPYGQHDAIVALRLELGRERDRAEAFANALRKEVRDVIAEVIREEIRKQLSGEREKGGRP